MASSTGKKGCRKVGRNAKKPAAQRYKAQSRWETNKARRIAKQARLEAKKAAKKAARLEE